MIETALGWLRLVGVTADVIAVAEPPTQHAERTRAWRAITVALGRPKTIAAVPLDVLPGGHLLRTLRELAQSVAPDDVAGGLARLVEARPALLDPDEGWAATVHRLLDACIDPRFAALVLRSSHPATIDTLVEEATAAGLAWLGDAVVATSQVSDLPPELLAFANEMSSPGLVHLLADTVRHQHRRLALFALAPHAPLPQTPVAWEAVEVGAVDAPHPWSLEPPAASAPFDGWGPGTERVEEFGEAVVWRALTQGAAALRSS